MARMKQRAWEVVDRLDKMKADFIETFIRNGEPKRNEEAKEALDEFTADLQKLLTRCHRISEEMNTARKGKGRGKSEQQSA
jgi:dsDNA-binding SOS-regulon protein